MARCYLVQAKMSEEEYLALHLVAKREALNISETLRVLVRRELDRQGVLIGRMLENGEKPPVLQDAGH